MPEKLIAKITHYFTNLGVAVLEVIDQEVKVGDTIHVKGATSDFEQTIDSMQVDKESVIKADVGQSVGLKVKEHARVGDEVYRVEED